MSGQDSSELHVATKLSDVKEDFVWYSLQFPELANLSPRVGHSIISLKLGKVLMIGGGNHGGALKEIFTVNLEPLSSSSGNDGDSDDDGDRVKEHPAKDNFEAMYEFFCAKDNSNNVWMFGGADMQSTKSDVVKLGEDSLEVVGRLKDAERPCPRTQGSNSALIECEGRTCIAVFAGGLKGEQPVSDRDLHLFDIAKHKWEKVNVKIDDKLSAQLPFGCQPPAVQGHAMTAIGSKIVLHGGINNTTLYDGYHWMNLEKRNEDSSYNWIDSSVDLCDAKPSSRAAHGIAKLADVDKTSPMLYMFGGLGEKGACNDLWSFNTDSMNWTKVMKNRGEESYGHYPLPRLDFAMCAVGLQNTVCGNGAGALSVYLIIHGGMNEKGELFNDAWVIKVR